MIGVDAAMGDFVFERRVAGFEERAGAESESFGLETREEQRERLGIELRDDDAARGGFAKIDGMGAAEFAKRDRDG